MVFLGEASVVDGPLTFHQASILKELHVVVGMIGIGEHTIHIHVHVKPQYQYVSVRTYVVTYADNVGLCGLLVSGGRDSNNRVNIPHHPLGGNLLCCCRSCS